MRLKTDGLTPLPRMLLPGEFLLHTDFQVDRDGRGFVAPGDRLSCGNGGAAVICSTGEQDKHPLRDSSWTGR
ncbi:hypothetical protein [Kitasatospora sp. NPDC088134]|uniref:hypothetical protein n=1 Tax=Kitasatospora sp. NPDC088134 TaxID=3364071 RepID=UPI0038021426